MALLHYHGKNILGVGLPSGDVIKLLPGINEVDDTKLSEMKGHHLFQARIKKGLVQILIDNIGKDGKRTVEDMLTYIPGIYDTKLLKKIIDTDGRDKVIKCASEQLDKIKNPAKAREDADNNDHFS